MAELDLEPKPLELPPIDQYRWPFIEPLGCLTLLAAQCDHELVYVIAVGRAGSSARATPGGFAAAADLVRHWQPAKRGEVMASITVEDAHLRGSIQEIMERYSELRERRHRAIHDAVSLGWTDGQGVVAVSVGYKKVGRETTFSIEDASPKRIAKLASDFDELRCDLSSCVYLLNKLS